VVLGNQAFYHGNYQGAVINYLEAAENDTHSEWIAYNLGNTFYVLGEYTSAQEEWKKAEKAESEKIRFHLLFNRGVVLYKEGQYEDSYLAFKEALRIRPGSWAAKVNLEYALEKMDLQQNVSQQSASSQRSRQEEGENTQRILEYVRRREKGYYESPEEITSQQRGKDW
jgi:tetratricopeptide (TPR) repeat protein